MKPLAAVLFLALSLRCAQALDPHKSLTQYSLSIWTQDQGLPQDTIRAIAQTADGYLWLGTDEGLARFDGYDFVVFDKSNGDLPSNSITALAAASDGSLWIGTTNGLTQYRDRQFHTYTTKQGLPDIAINALYEDHAGTLWIVAGVSLSRYQDGKFTNYAPGENLPLTTVRYIREDHNHDLWVAGVGAVVKMSGDKFVPMIDGQILNGVFVSSMVEDRRGNFWVGSSKGLIEHSADGKVRVYDARDGLPDPIVRSLWADRDGNIWAGTSLGLARLDGERFSAFLADSPAGRAQVRCLFEDRDGNLWVGANAGLIRLRNDIFTVYGKPEGMPSDEPNTVFQDHLGRIWLGFHDGGLMLFDGAASRKFTTRDGLSSNEIFSIRETRGGDLLIAARGGLTRMHDMQFTTFKLPDPLGRTLVFDALEDSQGRIWLAAGAGLAEMRGKDFRYVVPSSPVLASTMVTLCQTRDGAIWAGAYGRGLWRIADDEPKQFTTANGLPSDQIRSLYQDPEGTLWIGTFGGGLVSYRNGRFQQFTAKDGLLSDNVSDVEDDGASLWLSTTRGICRIAKQQLQDFAAHRRANLDPVNYGVVDGLRSAQCAPGYPVGGGGRRMRDGRLWFTTTRGLAVYDPATPQPPVLTPTVHLLDLIVDDHKVDFSQPVRLSPGVERIEIRYTGVNLTAPERVRYARRLEGLNPDWVRAGSRRFINYNSLRHGSYRFTVRAEIEGGAGSEASLAFVVLPHFYETVWFRVLVVAGLVALGWGIYQLRLQQIRYRFALVLEERARLAREIHDTLAQGFVGISSQLDAVAMCLPDENAPVRKILDLARRMARHSLTEARRSVMDLRAAMLEGQDLSSALESSARMWTAGSGVVVAVDVTGEQTSLPQDMEQHLLRITQEAVTNVLKHSGASKIWVKLHIEARKLCLRIADNGRGFDQRDVFSSLGGHFGLLGMRERAERLGGEFTLASHPGEGTEVEVRAPLP